MTAHRTTTYRARWIVPMAGPPLDRGQVTVSGGRIVAVEPAGSAPSGSVVRDLGDVVLLPGLVNAHTHLEFSHLASPLQPEEPGFAAWIGSVVASRIERDGEDPTLRKTQAVLRGMSEIERAGTAAIGEIVTDPWRSSDYDQGSGVLFHEVISFAASRNDEVMKHLEGLVLRSIGGDWIQGISPHAPYTVRWDLLERCVEMSSRLRLPLAMHLAESSDERELIASHSGPMVDRLRDLDAWDPTAVPRGLSFRDYLERLAQAHRVLVIHGNFLTPADWEIAARRAEKLSIVYCPRTHRYFLPGEYPLAGMLQHGVRVALGTDSRASNPDLDLWNDLRQVAQDFPGIAPLDLVAMATRRGAEALGLESQVGSIAAGKRAVLLARQLGQNHATVHGALEACLHGSDGKAAGTIRGDRWIPASTGDEETTDAGPPDA